MQIYDFFAGPGIDVKGNPGSPIIICDEIYNSIKSCNSNHTKINIYLNEKDKKKYEKLSKYLGKQKVINEVTLLIMNEDFQTAFKQWQSSMQGKKANLIFLDQNGVKQITKSVFESIVQLQRTDFIFFVSSSIVNRFKNLTDIVNCVPITQQDRLIMNGTNVHRLLANAYRNWLPDGIDYFLGSFSIKKGSNVYGLVFGSHHPLGIDKFLKVAWQLGGDANFDIDNDCIDPLQPSLFPEYNKPTKIKNFEKELENEVMNMRLKTNIDVYLFALKNGMLASHAKDALNILVKNNKLPRQSFHISYDTWKNFKEEKIVHNSGVCG